MIRPDVLTGGSTYTFRLSAVDAVSLKTGERRYGGVGGVMVSTKCRVRKAVDGPFGLGSSSSVSMQIGGGLPGPEQGTCPSCIDVVKNISPLDMPSAVGIL